MSEESTEAGATPEEETVVDPIASQAAEMAAEQEKFVEEIPLDCRRGSLAHKAAEHLCIPQPVHAWPSCARHSLGF